jgi:transcriptional regulator with XRE-family HTH domain
MPSSIAKRLVRARTRAHMTQTQLAKALGYSPQLVSAFENDRIRPTREQLVRVAAVLRCPVTEFTGEKIAEARLSIARIMVELQALDALLADVVEDVPEHMKPKSSASSRKS